MTAPTSDDLREQVTAAVRTTPHREAIEMVQLFGSFLHGTATTDSDVDLLITLRHPVGYFKLAEMQAHLEQRLGRTVDLVTPNALSHNFRDRVLAEAQPLYG